MAGDSKFAVGEHFTDGAANAWKANRIMQGNDPNFRNVIDGPFEIASDRLVRMIAVDEQKVYGVLKGRGDLLRRSPTGLNDLFIRLRIVQKFFISVALALAHGIVLPGIDAYELGAISCLGKPSR